LKTTYENTGIWLRDAKNTHFCGKSLADTLYETPITILLIGELGSGKTTFLNGFSEGLGILKDLPSPTFALEHHHETAHGDPFLHIDLYRLSGTEADAFVEQTSDFKGYRCIEWAQHLTKILSDPHITISMEDANRRRGHHMEFSFHDIPLPSTAQILEWRNEVKLPEHISAHCDAVADFAVQLGERLMEEGVVVRLEALKKSGQVHDLFRFIDFSPGASHENDETKEPIVWDHIRNRYKGLRHEKACAEFLLDQGLNALSEIVEVHGLRLPPSERRTIEQKLLYYADKRVNLDTVVSLDERFADFAKRYKGSPYSGDADVWYTQAKELEQELFQGIPPA